MMCSHEPGRQEMIGGDGRFRIFCKNCDKVIMGYAYFFEELPDECLADALRVVKPITETIQ